MDSERIRNWRPVILALITAAIITQIVALSPAPLEQDDPEARLAPEALVADSASEITLATKIPRNKIADYTVEGFKFASTRAGVKEWKLDAKRAFLYNADKMVHARQVTAYLYDADDQVTLVTGDEAQYFMDGRDLEVFGNVKTTFPDGFQTESEYLRYLPGGPRIEMPEQYLVEGHGKEENGQEFFFRSMGMNFNMAKSEIILPAAVKFTLRGEVAASPSPKPDASSKPVVANAKREETVIDSDHCVIDRKKQIAHFTMYPTRKLSERFVHITQPSLFARGRRADVNYGSFDKILQYMIVYEDVYIREIVEGGSVRYGTGGRADFDAHRDVIVLKEFPQVYQDNDTVTGDIIIVHRDTDIVEVEHSNAYSSGETAQ